MDPQVRRKSNLSVGNTRIGFSLNCQRIEDINFQNVLKILHFLVEDTRLAILKSITGRGTSSACGRTAMAQ